MADAQDNLNVLKVIDNQTIAAGGTFTSKAVDILNRKLVGNITLQIKVSGTGTAKFEWSQSNNSSNGIDGDFVKPVSGFSIITGFLATSGTDTDGKDLINVPMFNSQFFKIICTETGAANPITVDAWISMQ